MIYLASLFDALKNEDLGELKKICSIRRLPAGRILYQEGDQSWELYVLRRGRVKIIKEQGVQGEYLEIDDIFPTAFVGDDSFLNDLPFDDTAVVVEDSDFLVIPRKELDLLQRRNPKVVARFYLSVIKGLNLKTRRFNERYSAIKQELTDSFS